MATGKSVLARAIRGATILAGAALLPALVAPVAEAANYCPAVWKKGVMKFNFNTAFTNIETYNGPSGAHDDLLVTSFFNVTKDPTGTTVTNYFERDLVARVRNLDEVNLAVFDKDWDVQELTDVGGPPVVDAPNKTVWPNDAVRMPDGMVPFQAVAIPQGFHPAVPPGRLTFINLDDPGLPEYIVHQSTGGPAGAGCDPSSNVSNPKFYHDLEFVDMNGDGYKDIATVRSSFKVAGYGSVCFFTGELVWFQNPGAALQPNVQWQEHMLVGYPVTANGPDISIESADFENDGIPELVAASFFMSGGFVRVYGAPAGLPWTAVDQVNGPAARVGNIVGALQGKVFGIQVADLNNDGKLDVISSNHQEDNCFPVTQQPIPGRINVFEQPASGNVFGGGWIRHTIKDNIRPNPTFPAPTAAPGRLAPGPAKAFWPVRGQKGKVKPWVVVGGDEASKVWLLTPKSPSPTNWDYESAVIFDINDTYGANTTQTIMGPGGISPGEVISTIGVPSVRYDDPGPLGRAEIYIPVFEAKEIHVLTMRPRGVINRVTCPPDGALACPVVAN